MLVGKVNRDMGHKYKEGRRVHMGVRHLDQ